jgi:peptidoglycan/xylan/chitin deacetylase (PgdA/CDA1 family)
MRAAEKNFSEINGSSCRSSDPEDDCRSLINMFTKVKRFEFIGEFISRVDTQERIVALTFDDGPNPPYTNQILNILDHYQAKSTFFVIGRNVETHPETVRLIAFKGHKLGNHSYSHTRMILKSPSFIRSEVERTDQLLRELGVNQDTYFRPPYGRKLLILPYVIAQMQKKNIMWDVDPMDYKVLNPETIKNNVSSLARLYFCMTVRETVHRQSAQQKC